MVRTYNYSYESPFDVADVDREKSSIYSIPLWTGLLVIVSLWGIFGLVYLSDALLPTALEVTDEVDYPDSFITERAANDLQYLTSLGPKLTGSRENEYVVVEYLSNALSSIISQSHPNQHIEFDFQSATGGYYLDDIAGFMNVYDRVQNVIVKLHGKNNASEHSILVNSHFDTVPTSSGGSDDGINVVIMLEILRKLSRKEDRQLHNIIFLFNGAEEAPLKAAHGFIAHHKWANESKVLVNLESAGAGGKLILFQTGPETPWLLKYYSKVPHPYGSVSAEEIFQAGIIPSDTDFRIFRDFGNLVGVDMAYYSDGYRYHTKYDGFDNIPLGSYQHGGDNTLALVKSLANAPEVLEGTRSIGKAVYFDVFGLFLITYSNTTAIIVNILTAAFSLLVFLYGFFIFGTRLNKLTIMYFVFTILAIIFGWVLSVLHVIGLAYILDLLGKTMSWYGAPWFIFGLYVVPIIGLSGCCTSFINNRYAYFQKLSLGVRSQLQAHLLRLVWTLLLIVGTALNIRSSYIIMIPVLFSSLAFLAIIVFRLHRTVRIWLIIYLGSLLFPIAYIISQGWLSLVCFIPIAGRLGSPKNPELYIGFITLLYTLLATSFLVILTVLLRRSYWYYLALLGIFVAFFALLFTPLGFPYAGNADAPKPQRHWIAHTQRQFFDESATLTRNDSGILMLNMDRNSPNAIKSYVPQLKDTLSIEDDCSRYTFCAMPLTLGKAIKNIEYSSWIEATQPSFPGNETLKLEVVSKENLTSTRLKYTLRVAGPDRLEFCFTPKPNTTLLSISLIETVIPTKFTFYDRSVYVILYQLGKGDGTPLTFDFIMETPENHQGPTIDLGISARYVHEARIQKTAEYLEFLSKFPDWAHLTSFLAAYQSHII